MSYFSKDSLEFDGGNFDTQKMELLGERLELCIELSTNFLSRDASKDRSRVEGDMKIKEGMEVFT